MGDPCYVFAEIEITVTFFKRVALYNAHEIANTAHRPSVHSHALLSDTTTVPERRGGHVTMRSCYTLEDEGGAVGGGRGGGACAAVES